MDIYNRTEWTELPIDGDALVTLSENLLMDFYEADLPELTFSVVTAKEIRELNHQFRDVNDVTDILSFPAESEIDPETGVEYLGDLIVCLERAESQANEAGHSLQDEVSLLLIHGLLHLLGYDHAEPEEKAEMWALQDEYLRKYGIKLNKISGDEPFSEDELLNGS